MVSTTTSRSIAGLSVLVATALITGCSSAEDGTVDSGSSTEATTTQSKEGFPVTVTFAPEAPVTIEDQPERIVSLSPAITETLFAVGAGDHVVAVDEYSNYPEDAPLVQGLSGFTPNVESILDYDPDLVVLMSADDSILTGLDAAGVDTLVIPAAKNLDETYSQIEQVGRATGFEDQATTVVDQMKTAIDAAVATVPEEVKEQGLTYFHELGSDLFTVSEQTYIGQIYDMFGLTSIADGGDAYSQLSNEAIIAANPDLIFLSDAKAENLTAEDIAARPGWDTIDAVANGRIYILDDDIASRWGPRVSQLVEEIAAQLNQLASSEAVPAAA